MNLETLYLHKDKFLILSHTKRRVALDARFTGLCTKCFISRERVAVLYRKRMDMDNIVLYRKRMDMDKYFDAERSLRITGRDLCSLLIDKDKLHLSRPAFLGQNHHRRKKLHNKSFILVNLYCSGELFIPFCITREWLIYIVLTQITC